MLFASLDFVVSTITCTDGSGYFYQLNIPQHMRTQLRARWRANETAYLRERRRRVDQRSFVKLKTIGHGAFGVVSLVKEKDTGELYAMKQVRRAFTSLWKIESSTSD
jgi:hypothetical protein